MAAAKKAAAKKAAAPKDEKPAEQVDGGDQANGEQQTDQPAEQEGLQEDGAEQRDDDRGPALARAEQQGEPPVFGRAGESQGGGEKVAAHESGATYADGTAVPEIVDASTAAFSNGLDPVSGAKVGPTLDDPDA